MLDHMRAELTIAALTMAIRRQRPGAGLIHHSDRGSQYAAHVGRAGWKNWNVVRYARAGDFVLVTNNASDFRQLYAAQPLHAGLIILIPAVNRVVQQRLFKATLDELALVGEPVN